MKPFKLKFYATLKGSYHNKLFCFDMSKPYLEIPNILQRFQSTGNIFQSVYLTDLLTQTNYKLSDRELDIYLSSNLKQQKQYSNDPLRLPRLKDFT